MVPTIPLARALSRDCDGAIQQRGERYFDSGRVYIVSGSASRVTATVRGTSTYGVELARDGREIRASCTCPYFDVDICKHIWAVILAADARRLLQGNGTDGPPRLVYGGIEDEDLDEDEHEVDDPDEFDDDDPDGSSSQDFRVSPRDVNASRSAASVFARAPVFVRPPQISAETPSWRQQLARLRPVPSDRHGVRGEEWPSEREILYVIDVAASRAAGGLHLEILCRDRKKDGAWSKPRSRSITHRLIQGTLGTEDRRILASLAGAAFPYEGASANPYDALYGGNFYYSPQLPLRYRLREALLELTLPLLCRTGRCRLRLQPQDEQPLWVPVTREEGEAWQFRIEVRRELPSDRYAVRGRLIRNERHMDLTAPLLLARGGFLFTREAVARFEPQEAFEWVELLRVHGPIHVPLAQGEEFLAELFSHGRLPALELPEELRCEEVRAPPRPRLAIKRGAAPWQRDRLHGRVSFDYGGEIITPDDPGRCLIQKAPRRVLWRDRPAEVAAGERLAALGWRAPVYPPPDAPGVLELAASRLPEVVRELMQEGWHVEAEGRAYRLPGRFDIGVTSGIDWFELHGTLEFGEVRAQLPELLAAVKRGEKMVRLGDGSIGVLPEAWLKRYGLLANLSTAHEEHVRFGRSQVGLLDALVSTLPEARCDALFARLRDELNRFSGVEALDPPEGFTGRLRPYQKEGLGWFAFLRRFGFGGCLADDMGLGKTVQVLALLEARRAERARCNGGEAVRASVANAHDTTSASPARINPSLAVVPASLIFNWKEEAARFAPRLRVLDHTGPDRCKGNTHFEPYDLILTTYGTLRRDVLDFKDVRFDYLILDEAQAIKNASSASAHAVRLLQADHRLALSGTPIENHLGELWSLIEFLNPGMLGTASVFKLTQGALRDPDTQTRKLLSHAVRPFVLRRTKEQVIRELPTKVEQTLYCELESKQRRLYDELRTHYRKALLKRIEREGMARSKIQILEALLRLRQAALHPGLLDERRERDASAKLDVLLPRLREVLEEGHKALVFAQFTRMLGILRKHLEHEGVPHEYLDGGTRDREGRVTRFQTDAECRLFLISLKAGGLGLNLTAAQYVFVLDPWWNPAVEAQAIDRAHRIGQASQVIAYRLIARDTIEEKVLELQTFKRDLAEAIMGEDKGLIRNLGREDLERLMS